MWLDDQTLHEAAAQLRARHPRAGIESFRRFLKARFEGHSAGTDRLSRILKSLPAAAPTGAAQTSAGSGVPMREAARYRAARKAWRRLQQRLQEAGQRARRAEEGELENSRFWAMKVDQLRQQLLELTGREAQHPKPGTPRWLDLYRELQSARARIADLEDRLRAQTDSAQIPK